MNLNQSLKLLFLTNGIFVLAGIALVPIYALFAESVGANLITISLLASTLFVAKAIGTVLMHYFGDLLGTKKSWLICGFFLRSAGWISLVFASGVGFLFAIQIILGLSEGIGSPAFRALVAKNLDDGREVSEYADWEFILAVVGVVGTASGGFIASTFGFEVLFSVICLLGIISAMIATRIKQ